MDARNKPAIIRAIVCHCLLNVNDADAREINILPLPHQQSEMDVA
jgi:hypothetical protein